MSKALSFLLLSFVIPFLPLAMSQDRTKARQTESIPKSQSLDSPAKSQTVGGNPPGEISTNTLPSQKLLPQDAVQEFSPPRTVESTRPEQQLRAHDEPQVYSSKNAQAASPAFKNQPGQGKILGFDFARDPLNAEHPFTSLEAVFQKEAAAKAGVVAAQRKLLESRYHLEPKFDPTVNMSRGKPVTVGPTARLAQGLTWDNLSSLTPEIIREQGVFPYRALPHPLQVNGGQVFPEMQIAMFPRLERFDVAFDLPEAFLPEFPPAIFLQNRPELGDVSRGEVLSINNFHRLFKDLVTPVQLDGLRLLLTPLPQEEFNATDDRKTVAPSLGVACFDCHVNGHTTGQFHLSPDIRPQERRFRIETTSLRGMFNQQIHGSKRSLRSVEDFTEFEQRTAYFNGDPIHAMKKGFVEIPRTLIPHMAQFQNMLNFPPAPKLNALGRLDARRATESELRGEKLFFGQAQCSLCHPAPFYLDHQMHDLQLERFIKNEPTDGPIKAFTLRPQVLCQCLLACRKGGTVSIPGVYAGSLDKMPFGAAFAKGLTLRMGQTHVQAYLPKLLQHIERNEIDPSFVITQRIGLDSAENAYHDFNNQKDEWIKVVMKVA